MEFALSVLGRGKSWRLRRRLRAMTRSQRRLPLALWTDRLALSALVVGAGLYLAFLSSAAI